MPGHEVRIDLNADTFVPVDSQELAKRLRAETDLSVESDVAAYASVEGGPVPPDVVLYILHTLVPLGEIYAGVLSSVTWDTVKAALSRQGRGDSEVAFTKVTVDDKGRILSEINVTTSDPEIIKQLLCKAHEEDEV